MQLRVKCPLCEKETIVPPTRCCHCGMTLRDLFDFRPTMKRDTYARPEHEAVFRDEDVSRFMSAFTDRIGGI